MSVANEPDAALELRQENDELRGEVLRLRESLALAADEPPPTDDDGTALQALRERVRSAPAARGMRAAQLDALLDGWSGSRRPKFRRNGQREGWEYSYTAPGGAKFRSIASAAAAALEAAGEAAARPTPALAPRPSHSHGTRGAAAEAPAAAARPLKVSLVSEAAAREELREHLRGLPGVEASQLDNLLAGWQATRRRRADGTTYSFISPGGEEFTSVSRAAWAACRLAPVERRLRAEAERLRVENDALRNDPAAATRREAKLRAEVGRLRVENERLARAAQQPPVVVNHGRRDAGLGAWMAETFDHAVGTEPVVVNQVRPARRVTAGAPVVPPAPAVPAWPATEHPAATVEPAPTEQPPWAPPPPLGHAAAILAADTAFCAASAAALLNLREALSAVEALATSDFQGPMTRPVARLSIITGQLATHVAASEAQLPVRMAEAVAAAAPWTPHEDARLRTMGGNLGARSDWRAIAAWLGNSRTAGGVEARWRELTSGDGTRRTADEDRHAHTVERTHWKPEEDQRLSQLVRTAVKRDGSGGTWAHVAAAFPDCTAADAEARWRTLAARDPDRKRPREGHRSGWSLDEETRLREVVEAERKAIAGGAPKAGVWDRVAVALGTNRTGSAVSAHWQLMHRDGTRTAAARWTPDEEQKLRRLVEAERAANRGKCRGSFWDGAAATLGTKRTASAVKNRWQDMNSTRPSKKARTDEPPPPPEEAADDPILDPFGLRAGLAALFSPWGWGS